MIEKYNIGDTVELKSGGPIMTVVEVGDDTFGVNSVWCVWFDEKNTEQRGTFPEDAVRRAG